MNKKKGKEIFDEKKAFYSNNPVYLSKLLDPYTVKVAKWMHHIGFSANNTTFLTFILGILGIVSMFVIDSYLGLVVAAILITLRNIGDTVDGKIARGANDFTPIGYFSDLVSDWIIFHAVFFIAIGFLTDHIVVGFLCVTGYMSREFTRRHFTRVYGVKITETETAKKIPSIVSLARKYDLASWFWIIPFILLIKPVWIIYITAIVEYGLLLGEGTIDIYILAKKTKEIREEKRLQINKI